ncbi:hypothetical protein [Infirmifilum lucidum]|uniref:hypothetical protein n=1 Tax=Infirmifilum lucidum TaxID=2776706 RepID=UPI001C3FA1FE|nr:hypothetical protein [Infirmifilum lucidum]
MLLEEYRRWVLKLSLEDSVLREPATALYSLLKSKMRPVEPDKEHLEACKPYFPESEKADLYHATCLKTGATLISNDKHFYGIRATGLIRVLKASEAIREILS